MREIGLYDVRRWAGLFGFRKVRTIAVPHWSGNLSLVHRKLKYLSRLLSCGSGKFFNISYEMLSSPGDVLLQISRAFVSSFSVKF